MFKTRSKIPEPVQGKKAEVTVSQAELRTPSEEDSSPPSYTATTTQEVPPDVSIAFSNLDLSNLSTPSQKPSLDQCLAHLKLLEAFHLLRENVYQQDGLFGIRDEYAATSNAKQRAEQLAGVREKRWQIYVTKASQRFETWWETCVMPGAQRQTQATVLTVTQTPWVGQSLKFDCANLPPLDILMVWHAYMLNPRNYLEDCILYGKMDAWRTGLPWALVNSCIDNDSFEYDAGAEAKCMFESRTSHCWDSHQDRPMAEIRCPACGRLHALPWTTWDNPSAWLKNSNGDYYGEHDAIGYADKNFTFTCKCSTSSHIQQETTHGVLRVQKFRRDCAALKSHDRPMQGTCLNQNGLPEGFGRRASFFPNRFIGGKPSTQMMFNNLHTITDLKPSNPGTMNSVRAEIEKGLGDRDYIDTVNSHRPTPEERIALRRMMSCYWENASPFSLDLVGAVIRQGTFIEKMHRIDWLHSPAARFTMQRLLIKYDRYLTIVGKCNGGRVVVPTLDIDLAWHTHQLNPPQYYRHTVTRLCKFLNHDDKIEDTELSTGFEWTSKTYQKMYNELYSECTCWYCEAIRESHASALSGLNLRKRFGGKASVIEEQLNQVHSARDKSAQMNHISAHNAIRPDTTSDRAIRERNMRIKLECDYKKAVVKARKQGREPPVRDEYYHAYGYPLYMPVYVPYQGDPCVSEGMYPVNPSCATSVPGASGNCVAGTCGGGAAVGACGDGGNCSGGDGGGGDSGGGCGGCGGCG